MTSSQKAYRAFLKSEFWIALSARKRELVGKCERCRSPKRLQSHHKIYRDDWYDTRLEDLEVLCRKCHRREHGIVPRRQWMLHRDDELFSAILHRCHCLNMRLCKQESGLRPRDEAFLDNALRLYPPTKKDSCMKFHIENVRMFAKVIQVKAEMD